MTYKNRQIFDFHIFYSFMDEFFRYVPIIRLKLLFSEHISRFDIFFNKFTQIDRQSFMTPILDILQVHVRT